MALNPAHSVLVARRDLLLALAGREIRVKYKQSVMGMLWAVLMPTVIVCAGVALRAAFAKISGTHLDVADVASVGVRAVAWAFFVSSVRFSTNSLIANTTLVTKVYLPRELFPIASIVSQLADFGVAVLVLALLLAGLHIGVSAELAWVPVLLVILILFTTGLGILLSAASLFFRDVKYLVEVFLTFAIFFTPVFYDARMFGRWENVLMLNPVAPVLEGLSRTVVYHRSPDLSWLSYSACAAVLTTVVALWVFRRLEPYFAESV
jgi:homopolymeric O-antigen transport system permease protein